MKTLHSLSIVAALGLAGTVYAQAAETAPNSTKTQPSAQTSTGTTSEVHVAEAGATAGKPGATKVGTKVQMSGGESLGEVKEVLVDGKGDASYAVVSYGGVMGAGAKRTAIPWATVKTLVKDDKLIMDRAELEQAPVLSGDKTPDASSGTWSREADAYWRSKAATRVDSP